MASQTDFCTSLEWELPFTWLDRTGMHRLADGRLARIDLVTGNTRGTFTGFSVHLINKQTGTITDKTFRFDDYLDPTERKDTRPDYHPLSNECFVVIKHIGWEWYIAIPTTTRPFCAAVESFIAMFEED